MNTVTHIHLQRGKYPPVGVDYPTMYKQFFTSGICPFDFDISRSFNALVLIHDFSNEMIIKLLTERLISS